MTETLDEQCKRCLREGQDLISELAKDPDNNLFSNGLNIGRKIKEVEDRVSDKYAAMKETITALEMQNTELQERISTLEQALRFYADKENYKEQYVAEDCGCCSYWHHAKIGKDGDEGEIARAALIGGQP